MGSTIVMLVTDSSNGVQPKKTIDMYFAAAITAGEVVIEDTATNSTTTGQTLDDGQAGKKSTATDDLATVIGGALDTVAAGGWGRVQTHGVQTGVACKSNVAAGDSLMSSTDAAGRLATAAAGTHGHIVATALTAASSNTCTVRWNRT